ncbi:MAG: hypothetical protein HC799_08250 [Limnothrix sp. RL_2_0]|nr:hypothetical protein [Limnothrix sp. RL_2_0]
MHINPSQNQLKVRPLTKKTYSKVSRKQPKSTIASLADGFAWASVATCSTIAMAGYSAQLQADTLVSDAQSQGIAEAGMTRILSSMIDRDNRTLLTKTFDPLSSGQSLTHFGSSVGVNEWSTGVSGDKSSFVASSPESIPTDFAAGKIKNGSYRLVAYRYDEVVRQGTFVVEGKINGSTSRIEVTRDIAFETVSDTITPRIARNMRQSVAASMSS